jgi:hypothetical protein
MARAVDHFNLPSRARKLNFDLDHFRSRPGERIENHDRHTITLRVDVSQNLVERTICYLTRRTSNLLQIALGIEIVHCDAGARHNIVKVIEQQILPGEFELILRVRAPKKRSY